MERVLKLIVTGDEVQKNRSRAGVQGEANATDLVVVFDESWDGYAKKITWFDALGQNPVVRVLTADLLEDLASDTRTYRTTIPGEPLAEAGKCLLVIDGYIDGKRARSIPVRLTVDEAPTADNAGEPADPTPTQAEQLQTQIDTLLTDISAQAKLAQDSAAAAEASADEAAESAADADNSATDASDSAAAAKASEEEAKRQKSVAVTAAATATEARQGAEEARQAIENMTVSSETLATGSNAAVSKSVQNGVVNLNFGLPAGPVGPVGLTGKTGASIARIERTGGTGSPGTYDTYTVYLDNGTIGGQFLVYNGANGEGAGDFLADGSVAMTGALQMGGNRISGVGEPSGDNDAVRKVDLAGKADLVSGKVPTEQLPDMNYAPASHATDKSNPHGVTAAQVGALDISTRGTIIPNNANLNDYTTPGVYYVNGSGSAATITNTPVTNAGYKLVVEAAYITAGVIQTVYSGGTAIHYYRAKNGENWGAWEKHYTSGQKPTPADIGAAASSHNHAASEITSGTLAVARGGTGKASWTANRLLYPSATTTLAQLAFPSVAGSVLRQGTSGAPYWTSLADLAAALGGAKVETGSYTGTENTGPVSLTFNIVPKVVMVMPVQSSNSRVQGAAPTIMIKGMPNDTRVFSWSSNCGGGYINVTFDNKTVSWTGVSGNWTGSSAGTNAANAYTALNSSTCTYYYMAIG